MAKARKTGQEHRDEWTRETNTEIGEGEEVLSSESADHTSQRDGSTEGCVLEEKRNSTTSQTLCP